MCDDAMRQAICRFPVEKRLELIARKTRQAFSFESREEMELNSRLVARRRGGLPLASVKGQEYLSHECAEREVCRRLRKSTIDRLRRRASLLSASAFFV